MAFRSNIPLHEERAKAFLGSVRVDLDCLVWEAPDTLGSRSLETTNVNRIIKLLKKYGCDRNDPDSRVPATIDKTLFASWLDSNNLTSKDVESGALSYKLSPALKLTCLHGKHRLAAARSYLKGADRWWSVDLYCHDISEPLKELIRCDDPNIKPFSDGEIYRHIQRYQASHNPSAAQRWLSKLRGETKKRNIRQLRRLASRDNRWNAFEQALHDLLPFPGLWSERAFQLGCFNRYLSIKCPEEMTTYLRLIYRIWNHIAAGFEDKVDIATVHCLEGRLLRFSRHDYNETRTLWAQRHIFPQVQNDVSRSLIWARLEEVVERIPSIYTFRMDSLHLELASKAIRKLVHTDLGETLRESMRTIWADSPLPILQTHGGALSLDTSPSSMFDVAYRSVWLEAWRCFSALTGTQPLKDNGKERPPPREIDITALTDFLHAAKSAGFSSSNNDEDPLSHAFFNFIHTQRPQQKFLHDPQQLSALQSAFNTYFRSLKALDVPLPTPILISDIAFIDPHERWGKPTVQAYEENLENLRLDWIYHTPWETERGSGSPDMEPTRFAIEREKFRAFFGTAEKEKEQSDICMGFDTTGQMVDCQTPQEVHVDTVSGGNTAITTVLQSEHAVVHTESAGPIMEYQMENQASLPASRTENMPNATAVMDLASQPFETEEEPDTTGVRRITPENKSRSYQTRRDQLKLASSKTRKRIRMLQPSRMQRLLPPPEIPGTASASSAVPTEDPASETQPLDDAILSVVSEISPGQTVVVSLEPLEITVMTSTEDLALFKKNLSPNDSMYIWPHGLTSPPRVAPVQILQNPLQVPNNLIMFSESEEEVKRLNFEL